MSPSKLTSPDSPPKGKSPFVVDAKQSANDDENKMKLRSSSQSSSKPTKAKAKDPTDLDDLLSPSITKYFPPNAPKPKPTSSAKKEMKLPSTKPKEEAKVPVNSPLDKLQLRVDNLKTLIKEGDDPTLVDVRKGHLVDATNKLEKAKTEQAKRLARKEPKKKVTPGRTTGAPGKTEANPVAGHPDVLGLPWYTKHFDTDGNINLLPTSEHPYIGSDSPVGNAYEESILEARERDLARIQQNVMAEDDPKTIRKTIRFSTQVKMNEIDTEGITWYDNPLERITGETFRSPQPNPINERAKKIQAVENNGNTYTPFSTNSATINGLPTQPILFLNEATLADHLKDLGQYLLQSYDPREAPRRRLQTTASNANMNSSATSLMNIFELPMNAVLSFATGVEAHPVILSLFGIHYVPGQPTESMKEITAFAGIGENPSLHTIFPNLNLFDTVNWKCPTAEYFAGKTFLINDMMPGPRQFNDFHFQRADVCATLILPRIVLELIYKHKNGKVPHPQRIIDLILRHCKEQVAKKCEEIDIPYKERPFGHCLGTNGSPYNVLDDRLSFDRLLANEIGTYMPLLRLCYVSICAHTFETGLTKSENPSSNNWGNNVILSLNKGAWETTVARSDPSSCGDITITNQAIPTPPLYGQDNTSFKQHHICPHGDFPPTQKPVDPRIEATTTQDLPTNLTERQQNHRAESKVVNPNRRSTTDSEIDRMLFGPNSPSAPSPKKKIRTTTNNTDEENFLPIFQETTPPETLYGNAGQEIPYHPSVNEFSIPTKTICGPPRNGNRSIRQRRPTPGGTNESLFAGIRNQTLYVDESGGLFGRNGQINQPFDTPLFPRNGRTNNNRFVANVNTAEGQLNHNNITFNQGNSASANSNQTNQLIAEFLQKTTNIERSLVTAVQNQTDALNRKIDQEKEILAEKREKVIPTLTAQIMKNAATPDGENPANEITHTATSYMRAPSATAAKQQCENDLRTRGIAANFHMGFIKNVTTGKLSGSRSYVEGISMLLVSSSLANSNADGIDLEQADRDYNNNRALDRRTISALTKAEILPSRTIHYLIETAKIYEGFLDLYLGAISIAARAMTVWVVWMDANRTHLIDMQHNGYKNLPIQLGWFIHTTFNNYFIAAQVGVPSPSILDCSRFMTDILNGNYTIILPPCLQKFTQPRQANNNRNNRRSDNNNNNNRQIPSSSTANNSNNFSSQSSRNNALDSYSVPQDLSVSSQTYAAAFGGGLHARAFTVPKNNGQGECLRYCFKGSCDKNCNRSTNHIPVAPGSNRHKSLLEFRNTVKDWYNKNKKATGSPDFA